MKKGVPFTVQIILQIVLIITFVVPFGTYAATPADTTPSTTLQANPSYSRIFYYTNTSSAKASFLAHLDSIDIVAPQSYKFDSNGELKGSIDSDLLSAAASSSIKVMPLVTNGNFAQTPLQVLLNDSQKQDLAIAALINEAKKYNYAGWQIDFEQMDQTYRDKFSAFIQKFGQQMKNNGLISSVAVVAQVSENPKDYPKQLWHNLIGVYDYKSLASSTDVVSLMSYDDPNSKGPIAGNQWLSKVLKFSLKSIPHQKLSLGIPLYYWKWNDTKGKLVDIGGQKSFETIAKTYKNLTFGYSQTQEAPYVKFSYNKNKYSVWYENMQSIENKIALIKKYKLNGFSAWTLGLEMPAIFNVVNN